MRIAQIAPLIERVPPKRYGGTERVVSALTEQLVKMGHQVTLFASGNSITSAKLLSVYPKSLREAHFNDLYGANILTMVNIGYAYSFYSNFDVIHDHNGFLGAPTGNICSTPTVFTLHGPITPEIKRVYSTLNKPHLVTISKSQGKNQPNLNLVGTVYNGLDMEDYPFSDTDEGYLLFVGRISLEKGTHYAIQTALYLDLPLIIAAKLDKVDVSYFKEYVEPYLSDDIRWIGEVTESERNKLMSKAKAFLHPITWKEPFGLTMIEAMACGCPVVGFNKGSVPELIVNGQTGFVVDDLSEMIDAVAKIDQIDRNNCRKHSLKNFSAFKMAKGYEQIYKRISKKANYKTSNNSNKYQIAGK